jgi:lipopolysaccharide/colanic/teichoic acid biosynthesis glycosyltransferase
MGKRALDIAASAAILLLLLPLFLAIALWVKLDSPGPVFFRQTRVGLRGREFRIFKFRTMQWMPRESMPQITVRNDSRITRAGRCLRAYKVDELPQFLNVLAGDMSIVGPRPEVPKYVGLYPEELRTLVFSVRPGITDLASIRFRNESELLSRSKDPEATYTQEILPAKLDLCVEYVRRRDFWLDVKIILRTITAVLSRG